MIPPRPAPRPDRAGALTRLRLAARDVLSAQPDRLHAAWMAEMRSPLGRSVLVNDPALVAEMLAGRPGDFPKPRLLARLLDDLLGGSVFVTNGADWARGRRLIDPAFAGGRLHAALPAMEAAIADALERLGPGGEIEAEMVTSRLAADIIFRAFLSRPVEGAEARTLFESFRAYQRAAPLLSPLALIGAPRWLRRPRPPARAIRGLIRGLVAGRAARIAAGEAPDDPLSRMMTARDPAGGPGLSAREAEDQLAIFLLAGHETSAAALGWALWLLATHPEAQERVAAEGRALGAAPGLGDLRGLRFTRDVIRETLRLYPPVPMMLRETARPERFRGRSLPAGSLVILSPWHLHRHRRLWEAPDAFRPDRWEGEVPARASLPFSAGPRICPGAGFAMLECVLALARMLAAFRVAPAGAPPVPIAQLTLRSATGIGLRATPR